MNRESYLSAEMPSEEKFNNGLIPGQGWENPTQNFSAGKNSLGPNHMERSLMMNLINKKTICVIPFFLFIILTILGATGTAVAINVSQCDVAPDFSAQTINGAELTLSHLRGRPVFVTFWSSWCSRCQEEMEFLKDLKTRYPDVIFVAVTSESEKMDGEDLAKVQQTIEEWDLPFIVLLDKGLKIWDTYKVNALPTSVIIGKDGKVIFAEPNFYWASPHNIEEAMDSIYTLACN